MLGFQDLKVVLEQIWICSKLEELLLKKKSLSSGDSSEVQSKKVSIPFMTIICMCLFFSLFKISVRLQVYVFSQYKFRPSYIMNIHRFSLLGVQSNLMFRYGQALNLSKTVCEEQSRINCLISIYIYFFQYHLAPWINVQILCSTYA